jgi:hypothetical protein
VQAAAGAAAGVEGAWGAVHNEHCGPGHAVLVTFYLEMQWRMGGHGGSPQGERREELVCAVAHVNGCIGREVLCCSAVALWCRHRCHGTMSQALQRQRHAGVLVGTYRQVRPCMISSD